MYVFSGNTEKSSFSEIEKHWEKMEGTTVPIQFFCTSAYKKMTILKLTQYFKPIVKTNITGLVILDIKFPTVSTGIVLI